MLYQTSTGPKVLWPGLSLHLKSRVVTGTRGKGTSLSISAPSTVTRAIPVRQSSEASTRKVCWVGAVLSVCAEVSLLRRHCKRM